MLKQGTPSLRSYAYACFMLAPSVGVIYCLIIAPFSGQTNVIKYVLQNLIMSGRDGKWAYALIEYDLTYESLKSIKGQVVADFIVEHRIDGSHKLNMLYLTVTPWTLYFDGSVCNEGQGVDIMLVSPRNASFNFSS
jgi:hypothetical protein